MDRKSKSKSEASLALAEVLADSGVHQMEPYGPEAEGILKVRLKFDVLWLVSLRWCLMESVA